MKNRHGCKRSIGVVDELVCDFLTPRHSRLVTIKSHGGMSSGHGLECARDAGYFNPSLQEMKMKCHWKIATALCLAAASLSAQTQDAVGCIDVSVGGYKAPDYDCLSRQMGSGSPLIKAP